MTTLLLGFLLGAISFMVDMPIIGEVKIITDGWGIPFMMQAWWMFCLCSLLFVIVSLMTPKPDPKNVEGLTWDKPLQVITQGKITKFSDPRLLAGFLLVIMIGLYYMLR